LDRLDLASVRLLAKLPASKESSSSSGVPIDLSELGKQLASAATQLQQAAQALSTAGKELRASVDRPYHVTVTRGERS
jgi:hypothetical protein